MGERWDRFRDWVVGPSTPEAYSDRSGERIPKGRALIKLVLLAIAVVTLSYIDAFHPFGWDLLFEWPVYVVGGSFLIGFYGLQGWFRLLIRYLSSHVTWATGRAPVNKLEPVSEPFFPTTKLADEEGLYLLLDGGRLYYPFRWFEVNGSNRYVPLEGHDFVCIPWIVVPQTIKNWRTGELEIREINYSWLLWGPDGGFLNGDTTWARQHKNVPGFMMEVLSHIRGFRPDLSIDGRWRGAEASRVDFALYPKYDFFSMQPLRVPTEAKTLMKHRAGSETLATQGMSAAQRRQARLQNDLAGKGAIEPPPTPQRPPQQRPWNEEEF